MEKQKQHVFSVAHFIGIAFLPAGAIFAARSDAVNGSDG
jgi:hypothetical protein